MYVGFYLTYSFFYLSYSLQRNKQRLYKANGESILYNINQFVLVQF